MILNFSYSIGNSNWGQAVKPPLCFCLLFLSKYFLFILPLRSTGAHITTCAIVVKFGTLVEGHAKRP